MKLLHRRSDFFTILNRLCGPSVIEYAYFMDRILHVDAAELQKRKPFEVRCSTFLLFQHVLHNWLFEVYYFLILINFLKLNDKVRREAEKSSGNYLSRKPHSASI